MQDLFLPAVAGKGVLNVTLLVSEWPSSELALQLAHHMQVEVTVLVPKNACSEEGRRFAEEHNIAVREAVVRPGFDRLDWLAFPPEDLVIDVVLDFGSELGKQAQSIRESHGCKWVQVVHTLPEELGMYKSYPFAPSKGEEKTRNELHLATLANLVVAVGPKLKKAYSDIYQGSSKLPDVIQLTPGIFIEFSVAKKATLGNKSFRVLTFGRGDPKDFSLKGYDIAAKAIAQLDDNSYHLTFVGAPDGKQEDVADNLLKCRISKSQLEVRESMQSSKLLMELFCVTDLVIMPSKTEDFGLPALKALSAGLPILVRENSGFGDALRCVPLGKQFLVDSADPEDWAEAIKAVRQKGREERLKEIQALRASYEATFNWEEQCTTLVQKMWGIVHGI